MNRTCNSLQVVFEPLGRQNPPETNRFEWQDYTVFGISLGITVCIGLYFALSGGRQKTATEYFLANKG